VNESLLRLDSWIAAAEEVSLQTATVELLLSSISNIGQQLQIISVQMYNIKSLHKHKLVYYQSNEPKSGSI